MKNVSLIALILSLQLIFTTSFSQSCDVANNNTWNFFTNCQGGTSYTLTGNYSINIGNNSILNLNGNITINGTLTVNYQSNDGELRIPAGFKLTVTNLTFSGNPNEKALDVFGQLEVINTLDFGGRDIEIDGTGSITAGAITGGANVTCSGSGSCPSPFTAGSCTGGGICTGQGVTPVTLAFFNAQKSQRQVDLTWATETETNFHFFDVQRSIDGLDFLSIGKVDGQGTTNQRTDYQFTDELPFIGKNYYRLKSVDYDGYTEYFKIVAVDFSGNKQFNLSPNPSDGTNIIAKINFKPEAKASVIVYDNVGSVVGQFELSGNESEFNFTNRLKSGVYFAKFSSDGFTKVERLLVRE